MGRKPVWFPVNMAEEGQGDRFNCSVCHLRPETRLPLSLFSQLQKIHNNVAFHWIQAAIILCTSKKEKKKTCYQWYWHTIDNKIHPKIRDVKLLKEKKKGRKKACLNKLNVAPISEGLLWRLIKIMHLKVLWKLSNTVDRQLCVREIPHCRRKAWALRSANLGSHSSSVISGNVFPPLGFSVLLCTAVMIPALLLSQARDCKSMQSILFLKVYYLKFVFHWGCCICISKSDSLVWATGSEKCKVSGPLWVRGLTLENFQRAESKVNWW